MAVARWSWLGDRLALDFANTVRRRGLRYVELITSPADLAVWLEHEQDRVCVVPDLDDGDVARFVAARDHALQMLRAVAAGGPLPAADIAAVNDLILAAPAVRLLGAEPGRTIARPVADTDRRSRLLSDLAAAVVDLLTGPDAAQLALCDAPGCGQLYLRGRPNQQWCDPHCGNRARTQRHTDRESRRRTG